MYVLMPDPEICTGCRLCEMVCSLVKNEGTITPNKAYVRVMKREVQGIDVPLICYHCEDPPAEMCVQPELYQKTWKPEPY